jgi:hypothetical protein
MNKLLQLYDVNSVKQLDGDMYLVSYIPEISQSRCEAVGLDYIEVLRKECSNKNLEKSRYFDDVSIATAAAITSYGQIHITKIKLDILQRGGQIFYSDTDSIVTDVKLDDMVGGDLGQLKLEHCIQEGYFITSKTYYIKCDDGREIMKAKGVYSELLNRYHYLELYEGINVEGERGNTTIDYEKGTVNIGKKKVILHHDAFTKRQKIYDDNKR